jgi:hypothetical protein
VLLPVLVIGAALPSFLHKETWSASAAAALMDQRLSKVPPEVVVIGTSLAGRSTDPGLLAKGLGLPEGSGYNLYVAGSSPPIWYAVLENRVFEKGLHPRLVLVVGLLDSMLSIETTSAVGDYMDPDDAVIQQKTLRKNVGSPALFQLRVRRDQLKAALLSGIRNTATGLIFGEGPEAAAIRGEKIAEPALGRVFGADGAVDMKLYERAIPIVEEEHARSGGSRASVQESYIPDLVHLVNAYHSQIVFVRVPTATTPPEQPGTQSLVHDLVGYLNTQNAGWLDLSNLPLSQSDFADWTHLNAAGSKTFTNALVAHLRDMKVMDGGPLRKSSVPLQPSRMERLGKAPSLPPPSHPTALPGLPCSWRTTLPFLSELPIDDGSLRLAGLGLVSPIELRIDGQALSPHATYAEVTGECRGGFQVNKTVVRFTPPAKEPDPASRSYQAAFSDLFPIELAKGEPAFWVYPGTTGRFVFSEPWTSDRGPFGVDATAVSFGSWSQRATLGVGTGPPVEFTGAATLVRAVVEGEVPNGNEWAIDVTSPADGPYLLLTALSAGQDAQVSRIVGRSSGPEGQSLLLVGVARSAFDFDADGKLPVPISGPVKSDGSVWAIDVPGFDFLVNANIRKATDAQGCDPMQLLVDGEPATFAAASCLRVKANETQGWCHEPGRIRFSMPGKPDPRTDGHTYRAGLEPAGKCYNYRVIYPGETFRATQTRREFLTGADRLELRGYRLEASGPDGPLHVKVTASGQTLLDESVAMSASTAGVTFDLPGRVAPDDTSLSIELSTLPEEAYYLLVSLKLSEAHPFDDLSTLGGHP